ncbi:hypothetical protein [Euzebya sp.]|uniref:hypothetical protein n=1 Tax=Euzebya sp. TaxID=1971409 RepID=UPI003519D3B5
MTSPPAHEPSAALSLDLLESLLGFVAAAIHDRPVQQLVAARLMLETVGVADQLSERGMAALSTAGEQARQIMWALTAPTFRPSHLAEDLERSLSDAAPAASPAVRVDLGDEVAPEVWGVLVTAVHDVAVDVLLGGQQLVEVAVSADAEGVEARVTSTGGSAGEVGTAGPWVQLAGIRLADVGGLVTVGDEAGRRRVVLRVPT